MANTPISYPPEGMTRSEPIDRCCPLYKRIAWSDFCERHPGNPTRYRPLVMGCPEDCEDRAKALSVPGARERYRRCKSMEHIP